MSTVTLDNKTILVKGMERFDAGIIIRITTMRIALLHLFSGFTPRI